MWIKNYKDLEKTENRKIALQIAEAGFNAINTEKIIKSSVNINGSTLTVKDQKFDLNKFKRIKVIGFGKASCEAALALERILGEKIEEGIAIGIEKTKCRIIETFKGTHPRPSPENVEITKNIFEMSKDLKEEDLVIVIVSGGGSALLCSTESECEQGLNLYDKFLACGEPIKEMNTIRKHLSILKGGGLAKTLYPATVIGLIFSDVPGEHYEVVASGPTFKDETTVEDAQRIIKKNNLGKFDLVETPKEDKYFEKVRNIVLVSNVTALEAMAEKVRELGLEPQIISSELYDPVEAVLKMMIGASKENSVVLGGGEPCLEITKKGGSGGRNLFAAMRAIDEIGDAQVFVSIASDGIDNCAAAGAVVDRSTKEKIKELGLDLDDHIDRFDAYTLFENTGDIILTGPTNANVSDLMFLINKK